VGHRADRPAARSSNYGVSMAANRSAAGIALQPGHCGGSTGFCSAALGPWSPPLPAGWLGPAAGYRTVRRRAEPVAADRNGPGGPGCQCLCRRVFYSGESRPFLASVVVPAGCVECTVSVGRYIQFVCHPGVVGPGSRFADCIDGRQGCPGRRNALPAGVTVGVALVPVGGGASLSCFRQRRYCDTGRTGGAGAGGLGSAGPDERRTGAEDGIVPPAFLVAARPCQRSSAGERGALCAGDKGLVLHIAAPVANAIRPTRCRPGGGAAGLVGRRGSTVGFGASAATNQAEAARRLFHRSPDRLPFSGLSTGRRDADGLERGSLPYAFPCPGESGDVHGGRQSLAFRRP